MYVIAVMPETLKVLDFAKVTQNERVAAKKVFA
jgi:hypothetical protein